ncbi:MAG TPA: peroxiredoxin [Planctomycetota bacterium]|nr:peroxiredoxin [Planctomycetota bacterium]
MLHVGDLAPSFTLPDQDAVPVNLSDLRGRWVVLYFYPRDDTPGCTVEACEFTAALEHLRGLQAEVLGCSADSAAAHTKFIAKHALGIRLLTDADRSVMQSYGAYGKKMLYGKPVVGVIRSTVLIAPDGRVAHHWASVKAAGHAEQVHRKLVELQGGAVAPPPATAKVRKPPARPAAKKAAKNVKKVAKMAKKTDAKKAKKAAKKAKKAAKK